MKNIIVPIDFSAGALYALKYAVGVASKAKSNLTLVWVDNQVNQLPFMASSSNDMREEAKARMIEIIEKYQKKISGKLEYKLRKGKVYTEVCNLARQKEADLIIAGTYGGSGFEKFWIGSNAYRLVTHAPCPVITVRFVSPVKFSLKKIIMPVDNSPDTLQKLGITVEFARIFQAEVHVLSLLTEKLRTLRMRTEANTHEALKYLEKYNVKSQLTVYETGNITATLLDYATNIKADLISIMTEQELGESQALLGPNARIVIKESSVPVLSSHSNTKI
ncbi:MAG TPA: universal stress protein [Bacteroidales bacterium]|jgi:nucleotide-binding universal stress UspA family protein|nr:universal stress protein [Bacteroidales bacterium]MDI9573908.1 universal stress protein [Bacteroidota bacterium]OQC60942.1 MAG: putative universal stress protein [Bacteroidetes bacterium ADurb.Bin012]MBP9512025.1 universal stress protein [Bacteroidales bacterium]MBP9588495.1 universal stress protein [Bacteroidales bacterium]